MVLCTKNPGHHLQITAWFIKELKVTKSFPENEE